MCGTGTACAGGRRAAPSPAAPPAPPAPRPRRGPSVRPLQAQDSTPSAARAIMTRVKVHDVSIPLRAGMPTYEGEPGPRLEFTRQLSKGDSATVSVLSLGSHTGTHVDAPSHFLDGAPGVEGLSPEALVGPAFVAEHAGEGHITAAGLDSMGIPADCQRLLFKTRNG